MLNPHRRAQHRVDVACGYALGAYIGVSLTWFTMIFGFGFAYFAMLIAVAAGLFGTLRTIIGMPIRFWLIPVTTLVFVKLTLICSVYDAPLVIVGTGMAYSAALLIPVVLLFQRDFAKSIPAWVCKGCGYPLLGLVEPTCPECGEAFDPDKVPDALDRPALKDDRLQ